MLLAILPQGSGAVGLDVANCLPDVVYRLGFQSMADLQSSNSWVTLAELYQWADEAAQRLSYKAGVFVTYDASVSIEPETQVYKLPASHVFTLAAWLNGAPLKITRVDDLFALDGNAMMTFCAPGQTPTRVSFDQGSVGTATLYPIPESNGTLEQVLEEYPATVAQGSSTLEMAPAAQDYFTYVILAGARGKESEAAMPEMAQHFAQRAALFEQVFEHLWGPGQ